jgi:hypothetical protein
VRLPLIEVEVDCEFRPLQVERPTKLAPGYGVSTARPTNLPSPRSSSAALASSSGRGVMGMPGTRGAGELHELAQLVEIAFVTALDPRPETILTTVSLQVYRAKRSGMEAGGSVLGVRGDGTISSS